jgi:NADH:quinone reductase (non-electrogenic)
MARRTCREGWPGARRARPLGPRGSRNFVIGDAAFVTGPNGEPLPGLAPVAKQQGHYVGKLITRRVRGDPNPPPFRYRDEGALATIGRHSAIADFGWVTLTGFVAWLLWGIVHIFFLIGFRNRASVFLNWIWAWVTYGRGARLITGEMSSLAPETGFDRKAKAQGGWNSPDRTGRVDTS